jgi:hypothetical protein
LPALLLPAFDLADFFAPPVLLEEVLPLEDDFFDVPLLEDELPDLLELAPDELFFEAVFFEAVLEPDFELAFLDAPAELLDEDLDDAFLGAAFFEAVFLDELLEELLLLEEEDFFGTFSPFSLASDNPIAIACLREVTFFPLRPLFNFP